jgi:hypothetical protein
MLEQNEFDFDKTLESMKKVISKIESGEVELEFNAEFIQKRWSEKEMEKGKGKGEGEKERKEKERGEKVELDELD